MAPVLSFTAEEVWKHLPGPSDKPESIFFAPFPESKSDYLDEALHEKWERIWEVRTTVTKVLEEARKNKTIGHSLDARVHLHLPEKLYAFLQPYEEDLKSIFIVSSVVLSPAVQGTNDEKEMRVEVLPAEGKKCERCWNYNVEVEKTRNTRPCAEGASKRSRNERGCKGHKAECIGRQISSLPRAY